MDTTVTRTRLLVVAALIWQEGRVLLSRRRVDQAMPNLWEFPGGKVEAGEPPDEALAREVREELGCQVAVGRIDDVVFHAYPTFDLYMLVYACRLVPGSVPRVATVADLAWARPDELPGAWDILPADRPLIDRLQAEGTPTI